jgi:hypothetical protein
MVLVSFDIVWPREIDESGPTGFFGMLAGLRTKPVVFEVIGHAGMVGHRLTVPEAIAPHVMEQLQGAVPGIGLRAVDRAALELTVNLRLHLSSRRRPLNTVPKPPTGDAVLRALAQADRTETICQQWTLGRSVPALAIPTNANDPRPESWPGAFLNALYVGPQRIDGDLRSALRSKRQHPGWLATGQLGAHAETSPRARQLIQGVLGALRQFDAPGVSLTATRTRSDLINRLRPSWRPSGLITTVELAALTAWPTGEITRLPVEHSKRRLLPPSSRIPSKGRVIAEATFPGKERTLSLLPGDALVHQHYLAPTGAGKTTAMLHPIVADLEAGRGLVVVDAKGGPDGLIERVLERIPEKRFADVVLIDPADPTERLVGLNPLASLGNDPDLVADHVLHVFHGLYDDSWGVRMADVLHASLLALANYPGATLCHVAVLLENPAFRRKVIASQRDPFGLGSFWQWFDSLSSAEMAAVTAPVLRRLRPFTVRRRTRLILGQADPAFHFSEVFTKNRIVLLALRKGTIGPEASGLMNSLAISQLWSATLARAALSPEHRGQPTFAYLDEFQEYLHLPTDLGDALVQARGLGLGFCVSHQHLGQLSPTIRSAVLSNCRSRCVFQLAHEDAVTFARTDARLTPEDFTGLGRFEVYAQLVADGEVQPWCSARIPPPPPVRSDPEVVRAQSRQRYGREASEVEAALDGSLMITSEDAIGQRRRRSL